MTAGMPDYRLLPYDDLMTFLKLSWERSKPAPLQYGFSQKLKDEIAKYLSRTREHPVTADEIVITGGNSGGLRQVFRSYLGPGDIAIVESPLWTMTVNLMKMVGASTVMVGQDDHGILVDDVEQKILAAASLGKRIKLIYLQPLNHNPTGVSITRARAERLLKLAAEHRIVIVADEAYEPFWYDAKPCYLSAMSGGVGVLSVHTFSKTLGTGLRIGYVHGSPPWLAPLRAGFGIEASIFHEYAVGELMASGRFEQIISDAKIAYMRKINLFCRALTTYAGRHLARPLSQSGGFFVWVELLSLAAEEVHIELLSRGVEARLGKNMYGPGHAEMSSRDGGMRACHIGFSFVGPSEDELEEAAKRFGAACDAAEARLGTTPTSAL
eukprot:CAMPEP_0169078238 /NCGR_PEP_ID=MMETSP1015-20121227/9307_1 /TAXON_ID=342587 /ORGANISM="Karlodinium micrum, Strain CCMP2283" /LENGTH=381 /DNA_ID=CAMNT_0009137819 /DNA_START=196 /DNA_END=1341 /DNA_ORIENTATION=-